MLSRLIKFTKVFAKMEPLSIIDREKFNKQITTTGVEVPTNVVNSHLKDYKDFLLNQPKMPNIVKKEGADNVRVLILDRNLHPNKLDEWPEKIKSLIQNNNYKLVEHKVNLTYDDLNMQEILSELLPSNVVIPSGFETVGTIAHLNLRDTQLSYKNLIAQVLLDKNRTIKTVVNKTEKLSNVFRTPELEIIGGENTLETELKEGGVTFRLNFEKVYWNSKLQAERDRLLKIFKSNEVLCDMFCGIGPLSIRAAKLGMKVFANDLNPECIDYLKINAKLNKVEALIDCYNMDARDFVKKIINENQFFHHIYMNLPVDAIEFLDVFPGLFKNKSEWNNQNLPFVHVCGFDSGKDLKEVQENIVHRINGVMKGFKHQDIDYIHPIKDISSEKKMYCIGFRIPKEIAFAESEDENFEKIEKKIKIN